MNGDHPTPLVLIELHGRIHLQLPARADERAEVVGVGGLGEEIENFRLAPSACAAKESRGYDPASVDDQEISLSEKIRKVEKLLVPKSAVGSIEGQKPRCVAFREGLLSNPVRRQVEVEIAGLQKSFFCGRSDSERSRPKCL
jgi:hypothetical protein